MSNILYKPNITYDKNYFTEGKLNVPNDNNQNNPNNNDNNQPYVDRLQEVKDRVISIQNVLEGLPTDLSEVLKVLLGGVQYMIKNIGDTGLIGNSPVVSTIVQTPGTSPSSTETPTTPGDNTPSSYIQPINPGDTSTDGYVQDTSKLVPIPTDVFSDSDAIVVNVEVVPTPKTDLIDQEYQFDITCIFQDYLKNLEDILSDFYNNIIALSTEVNVPSFMSLYAYYDGNTNKISTNMKPMSDLVIRNQIITDQKIRMLRKLFDIDSMIVNIRACKSSSELRKRYYEADYVEEDGLLSMMQNDLLSTTRQNYDIKYNDNLYNLYKYLNSSVILSKECLNLILNTSQAKSALIKNEGVSLQW